MKVTTEQFIQPCGCRAVGECHHNYGAEFAALDELVDLFAAEMKRKLRRSILEKGRSGWDDPAWPMEKIQQALTEHVAKGDPVDVANFAAFWWNKQ